MTIIICPGVHPPELTDRFVQSLELQNYLVLPTQRYLPYNAISVYQWLNEQQLSKTQALSFIAFSAGVVGGFGAAMVWQLQGGKIHTFIAFDGWGVPLVANFPIYRVSHDYFTHWSSTLLGAGRSGFYVEPAVEHLELWRSPTICGWRVISSGCKTRDILNNYLADVLNS